MDELHAPFHSIPSAPGTLNFQGSWTEAGAYWIEADPYDLVAQTARLSFTIRRASDRTEVYRLLPGRDFIGSAEGAPFSDGQLLAFRVRAVPSSVAATVQVRDLATGALRFSLTQPKARPDDYFGQSIWFTENRILVAAPGRDWLQRDSGVIYLYNRADGRYLGAIGTGAKNAGFGSVPSTAAAGGEQPLDVPYVQVSGKRALIVHGRRAYLFDGTRLSPLVIPSNGLNRVSVRQALLTANRVVLSTTESLRGYVRSGRVLGYDLATRRLRYQLRAAALNGSYDFPSGIATDGTRLHVFNSFAGYIGADRQDAIHAFDLATGRRLLTQNLSSAVDHFSDSRSFTLSSGRLWLRRYNTNAGVFSTASRLVWHAFDPASLAPLFTLTPPGDDRFRGGPPVALPDGRLAVAATRTTKSYPWATSVATLSAANSTHSTSSVINIDPFTTTTAGVLVYDLQASSWTHRLVLENAFGPVNQNTGPQPFDNLLIATAPAAPFITIRHSGTSFAKVARYDLAFPDPQFSPTLEGRLTLLLEEGYGYELFRRDTAATPFVFHSSLGLGAGQPRTEIVPYADTFADGAYRLDGQQISRRLTAAAEPVFTLAGPTLTGLASFGDTIAVGSRPSVSDGDARRVDLLDLATGTPRFSLSDAQGPLALNDDYLVSKSSSGAIQLHDAATGASLPLPVQYPVFGTQVALSGDRLVTTSVHTFYEAGSYLHVARVNVFSLPDGHNLYSNPFTTRTSSFSHQTPSLDLAVSGDAIIVRTRTADGDYADAGRVRVLDLATGDTRYELDSPAPAPGDYFGGWLAAAGDWLAVGSPGSSEVFVYDLPTGALRHTLALSDRPDGITNYGTVTARLVIDADTARLAWLVNDDVSARGPFSFISGAAYVFDLLTGLEEAKIKSPATTHVTITGLLLVGDRLLTPTSAGQLLETNLAEPLAAPLLQTSLIRAATPTVRLEFPTRRGISYQPEASADEGATWTDLGEKHHGTGTPATLRIPIDHLASPESLRFRLRTARESAPPSGTLIW